MDAVEIIEYERKHRSEVLSLMFYSRLIHTHLDWYQVGHWLDSEEYHVHLMYEDHYLVGVMGANASVSGVGWVRLIAIQQRSEAARILNSLWQSLLPKLKVEGMQTISILVINPWLKEYLGDLGFSFLEDVVTLQRGDQPLPDPPVTDVQIRNGYLEDIAGIAAVDHSAFDPAWQLSLRELRQAQRQTASSTVAVYDGQIVGYQLSTKHQGSGHLARLAVHPAIQGKRVGAALLHHLLENMAYRGVRSMTVNTQASNTFSQRLYQRYGFFRNGYDIPIWQAKI
ncbi:MAG: GNAT family N-acetyltransferase [Anaerolineae bacterium]|nr:GNAT family N-acetyltransferase [Anaerolineae bacterium]